jgi:hypothetical protein
MERALWTDERLDSEMEKTDRSFDRVFEELRADCEPMRADMRAMRTGAGAVHGDRHTDFVAST